MGQQALNIDSKGYCCCGSCKKHVNNCSHVFYCTALLMFEVCFLGKAAKSVVRMSVSPSILRFSNASTTSY